MTFKVTIDGVVFECPTMAHAVELYHRLKGRRTRRQPDAAPKMRALQPKAVDLRVDGGGGLIDALEAEPFGLVSEALAERLGISTKSIPPMILGLKRKSKRLGLDFDSLISREVSYDKGKPVSRYRLTDEGRRVLAK